LKSSKRSDTVRSFVGLPKRWIVERTQAWLNRYRQLAKDWKKLQLQGTRFPAAGLIRLLVRRLCNPT
jgi:transposase